MCNNRAINTGSDISGSGYAEAGKVSYSFTCLKPGYYKAYDGSKAQIITYDGVGYVFGTINNKPTIWDVWGNHMCSIGYAPSFTFNLIAEWIDPPQPIIKWIPICMKPADAQYVKLYDEPKAIDGVEWRKIIYTHGHGIEDITDK